MRKRVGLPAKMKTTHREKNLLVHRRSKELLNMGYCHTCTHTHTTQEGESLNNKLCTFTVTRKEFRHQHWYHCHTCGLVDGTGACSVCAKVCHKVRI